MTRPSTTRPGSGTSRSSERAVTDFPEPDSPTIPTVSPSATSKLTPSTALTTPAWVKKWVLRFSTRSRLVETLPPHPRVERIAQSVADEVESHQGQRERDRRGQHDVGSQFQGVEPVCRHGAPGRGGGWD